MIKYNTEEIMPLKTLIDLSESNKMLAAITSMKTITYDALQLSNSLKIWWLIDAAERANLIKNVFIHETKYSQFVKLMETIKEN